MGFRRRHGAMDTRCSTLWYSASGRVAAIHFIERGFALLVPCTPHEIALLTHSSYTNRTARTVTIEQAPLTSYCGGVTKNYGYQPPSHCQPPSLCALYAARAFNFAPSFGEKRGRDVGLGKAPRQIVSLGTHIPSAGRINFLSKKSPTPSDPFGEHQIARSV